MDRTEAAVRVSTTKYRQLLQAEAKLEAVRELLRDETLPAYWRRQIKQAIMEDK